MSITELREDGVFRYRTIKTIYGNYAKGGFATGVKALLWIVLALNFGIRSSTEVTVLVTVLILAGAAGFLFAVRSARKAFASYEIKREPPEQPGTTSPPDYISGEFTVKELQVNKNALVPSIG